MPVSSHQDEAVHQWSWHSLDRIVNVTSVSDSSNRRDMFSKYSIQTFVVVRGRPDERTTALEIGDAAEQTRVVILEITLPQLPNHEEVSLSKKADFVINANAASVSIAFEAGERATLPSVLQLTWLDRKLQSLPTIW